MPSPSIRRRPASARVLRLAVLAAFAAGAAAAFAPTAPEPRRPVDPNRYLGRWYEVARAPNKIQDRCEAPTADWSRGPDGVFHVLQTCHIGSPAGPLKIWRGSGRIISPTNAKIRIGYFGGLIQQDYWLIDRADDYSWFIMSTPNPRYAWIFSRNPALSPGERASLITRARDLGYDVARFIVDEQPPRS